MYINIIKVLESISKICWLQKSCSDCPFKKDYGDPERYYCSINETPDKWQIDSKCDDSVYYKIEKSWLKE